MAKVTFGPIVMEARGKLGSQIFSKNRFASYVKIKKTPTNPKSGLQTFYRGQFKKVVKAWSATLTDQQRQLWTSFAVLINRHNVLGEKQNYSGFLAFCLANVPALKVSAPLVATPPPNPYVAQITSLTVSAASVSASTLAVNWTVENTRWGGFFLTATPVLPAGRNYIKSRLKTIDSSNAQPTLPINEFTNWKSAFGTPVAGQRFAIGLSVQGPLNLFQSLQQILYVTWTA